jgi:hypothetical protein
MAKVYVCDGDLTESLDRGFEESLNDFIGKPLTAGRRMRSPQ